MTDLTDQLDEEAKRDATARESAQAWRQAREIKARSPGANPLETRAAQSMLAQALAAWDWTPAEARLLERLPLEDAAAIMGKGLDLPRRSQREQARAQELAERAWVIVGVIERSRDEPLSENLQEWKRAAPGLIEGFRGERQNPFIHQPRWSSPELVFTGLFDGMIWAVIKIALSIVGVKWLSEHDASWGREDLWWVIPLTLFAPLLLKLLWWMPFAVIEALRRRRWARQAAVEIDRIWPMGKTASREVIRKAMRSKRRGASLTDEKADAMESSRLAAIREVARSEGDWVVWKSWSALNQGPAEEAAQGAWARQEARELGQPESVAIGAPRRPLLRV